MLIINIRNNRRRPSYILYTSVLANYRGDRPEIKIILNVKEDDARLMRKVSSCDFLLFLLGVDPCQFHSQFVPFSFNFKTSLTAPPTFSILTKLIISKLDQTSPLSDSDTPQRPQGWTLLSTIWPRLAVHCRWRTFCYQTRATTSSATLDLPLRGKGRTCVTDNVQPSL